MWSKEVLSFKCPFGVLPFQIFRFSKMTKRTSCDKNANRINNANSAKGKLRRATWIHRKTTIMLLFGPSGRTAEDARVAVVTFMIAIQDKVIREKVSMLSAVRSRNGFLIKWWTVIKTQATDMHKKQTMESGIKTRNMRSTSLRPIRTLSQ